MSSPTDAQVTTLVKASGRSLDPLLTTKEAAARLNKHPVTLWKWRQLEDHGGLPFVRVSARTVGYRESAIEALLNARTVRRDAAT
jgi:hypothetical protein